MFARGATSSRLELRAIAADLRYTAGYCDMVAHSARRVEVTSRLESVLAEISAINLELLARGELS
jgi:hypothetical protein